MCFVVFFDGRKKAKFVRLNARYCVGALAIPYSPTSFAMSVMVFLMVWLILGNI